MCCNQPLKNKASLVRSYEVLFLNNINIWIRKKFLSTRHWNRRPQQVTHGKHYSKSLIPKNVFSITSRNTLKMKFETPQLSRAQTNLVRLLHRLRSSSKQTNKGKQTNSEEERICLPSHHTVNGSSYSPINNAKPGRPTSLARVCGSRMRWKAV